MTQPTRADAFARQLYRVLRDRTTEDKRLVFRALSQRFMGMGAENKELALSALRLCADEIERTPSRRAYDSWREAHGNPRDYPSSTFIRKAFEGSWRKALNALGVEGVTDVSVRRATAQGPSFSREELVAQLRTCAQDLGTETFTQARHFAWAHWKLATPQWSHRLATSSITFQRQFGTWQHAMEAAFGEWVVDGRTYPYSEDEILSLVRHAADAVRPLPLTLARYDQWRRKALAAESYRRIPHGGTIIKQRGPWIQVLLTAGIIDKAEAQTRTKTGRGPG